MGSFWCEQKSSSLWDNRPGAPPGHELAAGVCFQSSPKLFSRVAAAPRRHAGVQGPRLLASTPALSAFLLACASSAPTRLLAPSLCVGEFLRGRLGLYACVFRIHVCRVSVPRHSCGLQALPPGLRLVSILSTGLFPAEVSDAPEVQFSNIFFCGCVFGVEHLLPSPRSRRFSPVFLQKHRSFKLMIHFKLSFVYGLKALGAVLLPLPSPSSLPSPFSLPSPSLTSSSFFPTVLPSAV